MHRTPCPAPHLRGFSLLELAIVVVIIGLILGAAMAGKRMIRQSELQSITVDYSTYTGAVANFRQQYGGWPGDLLDATTFWSSAGGTGAITDATCRTGLTTGTANLSSTCNGDNDGQITSQDEPYLAWQHLMLAKMVKGNFAGVSSNGASNISVIIPATGGNVPGSKIKRAGWTFGYKPVTSANANYYDEGLSNYLAFGLVRSGDITNAAALTPEEASQIDTKLDDGKPAYGRITTLKSPLMASCTSSDTDSSAVYNFASYKSTACALMMSLTLK